MVWCGVVWCGMVWCGVVWYDVVWQVKWSKKSGANPFHHQLQGKLGGSNGSHAVVYAAGAQTTLGHFEAATFAQHQGIQVHPNIREGHLTVAVCVQGDNE